MAHMMHRDSRTDYPQGVAEGINERIDAFFIAEKWEGEIENLEPDKCDDISWFDLASLPQNIVPYIKQALEHIKNKVFYSEYGWENV